MSAADPRAAAVDAAMAAVWERFRGTMDARVAAVAAAAEALGAGRLDPETRRSAEREAHKLAGSVGTFGFTEGSRLAREAEEMLAGEAPLGPVEAARLGVLAAALRGELDRPAGAAPAALGEAGPLLLIADSNDTLAGEVAEEAASRGMRSRVAASLDAALHALREARPDVVILDLELAGDGMALLAALRTVIPPVPAVVLSARQTFPDRVEVARHGGRAFLARPTTPEMALDAAQRVLEGAGDLQSTVLAVDDDPAVLKLMGALLGQRGVRLEPVSDPLHFWDALNATNPDVVVLDVDMPAVNGLEICRVLRNDPRWRTVPVLFLTARTDAESVERVFAAGADDYVAKPIVGPELVNRIVNRLERVQLLRHLADTDPLTGLANRRRSSEQMEQLLRLALRQEQPFSLAVIDLDHFKRVNDRWGHLVGDEVLKRVSRLLSRHFRGEDVVARWGGEEFVVGLFGMRREDGVNRLRAFQERLAAERFGPEQDALTVTVSAGLAQFPLDADSVEELYRAADGALYQAKAAGRDCVRTVA